MPDRGRVPCSVCGRLRGVHVMVWLPVKGGWRVLCPGCHERWMDQAFDLGEGRITAQARVAAVPRVLIELFVLDTGGSGSLFCLR
jgi:hypothetical protein